MLGDPDRELVAAAVDGELPDDREPLFRRLLAESADARELFHHLLADRQALQALPHLSAPENTADLVLRRIARLPQAVPSGTSRGLSRWLGYAVAASVFVAAGGAAYWADHLLRGRGRSPEVVQKAATNTSRPSPPRRPTPDAEQLPPPRPFSDPSHAQATVPPTPAERLEIAPPPRTAGSDAVIGFGPHLGVSSVQEVDIRLPFLSALDAIDRPETRSRLTAELSEGPAHRIDLFCTDLFKAGEQFQTAARAAGLHVTVDATSHGLAENRLVSAFCVYTESLTPTEAVALFERLAKQVRAAGGSVIGECHVYPAGATDQRELRDLLGADLGPWQRGKPATGPRSVAAGTADQLAAQLGKGHPGAKTALQLTYLPVAARTAPGLSKEVRTFLAQRGERRPDAGPLFLVFRTAN